MSKDVDQRSALMERVDLLWSTIVRIKDESVKQAAFSDWGSAQNSQAWSEVYAAATERLRQAFEAEAKQPGPEGAASRSAGYARGFAEIIDVAAALELLDTGGLSARLGAVLPDGGVSSKSQEDLDYDKAVAAEVAAAESAGRKGPLPEWVDSEKSIVPDARLVGLDPEAAQSSLDATGKQMAALAEPGSKVRVNRLDGALLDLVRLHLESSARKAGLRVDKPGFSRPAVINAVLAAVLSSAGVAGVELDEEGLVLVDLISRSGDLERSMLVDGHLRTMGRETELLKKTVFGMRSAMNQMNVEMEAVLMVSSYALAERAGLAHSLPPGQGLSELPLDEAVPLMDHLVSKAIDKRRRIKDAEGRSTAGHPDRKKKR